MSERKKVNLIGFVQDPIDLPLEMKHPIPKDYPKNFKSAFKGDELSEKGLDRVGDFVDYDNLELCYADDKGNVHFSPEFNPEPYVHENEVYLPVGNLCMKYGAIHISRMTDAMAMVEELEKS